MLGWLDSELQGLTFTTSLVLALQTHTTISSVCVHVCVCVDLLILLTPLNTASQNWG